MAIDWDHLKAKRFVTEGPPPTHWPSNVRPISLEGVSFLGIEPDTNKLYWDGKEIVLRDTIRLDWPERLFTFLIAVGTFGYFIMELGKLMKWWG